MFYEERLIDGVWHCRGAPDGDWSPMNTAQLHQKIEQLNRRAAPSEPVQQEQPEIRVIPPADAGVQPIAWMHTKIDNTVITHRPMDIERRPDYWIPLYDHPAAPSGYVMVPVEPTEEMMMAGAQAIAENIRASFSVGVTKVIYNAMLSAAKGGE